MKAVTVRNGNIFWRGCFIAPERAERLAAHFDTVTDWFAADARDYAKQLRTALRQIQPLEKAA